MGIIDSTHYRLSCEKCGAAETLSSHQSGSGWAPGNWGALDLASHFDTILNEQSTGNGPEVVSAICKKCGSEANIENHMFSKPAGW